MKNCNKSSKVSKNVQHEDSVTKSVLLFVQDKRFSDPYSNPHARYSIVFLRKHEDSVTKLLLVNSSIKFRDPYSNPHESDAGHFLWARKY